mgnify:CR=1 FL=1
MRKLLRTNDPWVFSRTACLGNDLYRLLSLPMPRLNIQKGRADELIRRHDADDRSWISARYFTCLARPDIWPLVLEQELRWWMPRRPPEIVLMDSYSELTDQLFRDREESNSFCANFNDLKRSQTLLRNHGLLNIDVLPDLYTQFFSMVHERWPHTPIVFIHFPTHREVRPKFLERADAIRDAVERIAMGDSRLISLKMEDGQGVRHSSGNSDTDDPFPYHYDSGVYTYLLELLRKTLSPLGV